MKEDLGRCSGLLLIACVAATNHIRATHKPQRGKKGIRSMKKRICSLLVLLALAGIFAVASAQTN
jgi:hypothetical protein